MTTAPGMLRVKRKRDEEPIDSLYVGTPELERSHKRIARTTNFIFRRRISNNATLSTSAQAIAAAVSTTDPTSANNEAPASQVTEDSALKHPRTFQLAARSKATGGKRKHSSEGLGEDVAILVESRAKRLKHDNSKTPSPRDYTKTDLEVDESRIEDEGDFCERDKAGVDEGDYVFDTFLRERTTPMNCQEAADTNRVGYLFLAEEDQEEWEYYGEELEEDLGPYGDEDEDENAENYYQNDYPEDEVDDDDEFDRDPYKYRKGIIASDEEYDLNDSYGYESEASSTCGGSGRSKYNSDSFRTPADL